MASQMELELPEALSLVENPMLTIEELKNTTGVTDDLLKNTLCENDQYMVAGYFHNLDIFLDKFNLDQAEKADIQKVQHETGNRLAMVKVFKLWRRKSPTKATYGGLVQIALDLKEGNLALEICKYLFGMKQGAQEFQGLPKKRRSQTESTATIRHQNSLIESDTWVEMRPRSETITTITFHFLLADHRSYHNEITGREAEHRLKQFKTRCYLTRFSENKKYYILSVCEPIPQEENIEQVKKHFKININASATPQEEYWIYDIKKFDSVEELLQYYESHRIHPALADIGKCISYKDYIELLKRERRKSLTQSIDLSQMRVYKDNERVRQTPTCTCSLL